MKLKYEVKPEEYSKVIYGDSVTSETPVIFKHSFSNKTIIDKISNLSNYTQNSWQPYTGFKIFDFLSKKEYIEVPVYAFTHLGWKGIKKVIRHKTTKLIYRVYTNIGMIEVTEDHSLLDYRGKKIKPCQVKEGVTKLLYDDRIFKTDTVSLHTGPDSILHRIIFEKFNNQLDAMKFFYFLKQKGIDVRVKCNNDMYIVYNVTDSLPKGTVLRIEKINDYQDYVYDIETTAGTFQAGVGSLIVKNTDSCMIELKTKSYEKFQMMTELYKDNLNLPEDIKKELEDLKTKVIEESFKTGAKLAQEITKNLFENPIELEFEKVYHPFIILTKKRYIGNYYGESPHKIDKVEKKGIVLSRRDNPDIVKKVYEGIIAPLLEEGSRGVNSSISFLKERLQELKNNETPLEDLVITKTLAKGYGKLHLKKIKDKEIACEGCKECKDGVIFGNSDYKQLNSPHVALAIKLRQRDRGSAPVINDRINYVFIKLHDNPKAKLYERAEELAVVKQKQLHIDYLYYIQNQLKNPICEVLNLIMEKPEEIFEEFTKDMVEPKKTRKKKEVDKNQPSILKWIGGSKS